MLGARSFAIAVALLAACSVAVLQPATASAQTIDLSLNVFYATPSNQASGGTWTLTGKSSGFGIAGLEVHLKDIATAQLRAPRGTVNGNDGAGFNVFTTTLFPTIILGQAPLDLGAGEQQGAFYGVGQLTNGAPNYPGRPAGTNFEGPPITTLTAVQDIPWAVNDPFNDAAWSTGALLLGGTFAAGVTPGFNAGTSGNVFSSLGTQAVVGNSVAAAITTIVRTNFAPGSADYNHNGIVDAADYVLWRNSNNTTVFPGTGADGNGDGFINNLDYQLWRSHFGLPSGSGSGVGSSTTAVPEPASMACVAIGALMFSLGFCRFGRRSAGWAVGKS